MAANERFILLLLWMWWLVFLPPITLAGSGDWVNSIEATGSLHTGKQDWLSNH